MILRFNKSHNYSSSDEPRYAELDAKWVKPPSFRNQIKVVSYNIKFALKIDQAIHILSSDPKLNNTDVILLQEMDLPGVAQIAKTLQYNYVYYPAIVHPAHGKDFGNAILSKWPMLNDKKIILPYRKPTTRQRIAVSSVLKIGDILIQVFSVHMGIFIKPSERKELVEFLINHVSKDTPRNIIAGDFNTFTRKHHHHIHGFFQTADYHHASHKADWTYKHWYLLNKKSNLDHIYAKGFDLIDNGIINNLSASDHVPVWALFNLEK